MFEIYQRRPILAWSLTGLGLIVAYLLFWPRSSSASSSSTGSGVGAYLGGSGDTGSSDAYQIAQMQTQAQVAVALAQLNDDASARASAVELETARLAVTRELELQGYNLEDRNAERAFSLTRLTNDSSERVGLATLNAQQSMFAITAANSDRENQRSAALNAYLIESNNAIQSALVSANLAASFKGSSRDSIVAILNAGRVPMPQAPTLPGGTG